MSKFKVGDKVKCTYSSGGTNFIPGHIYKVVTNTLNQPAIAAEANGQLKEPDRVPHKYLSPGDRRN